MGSGISGLAILERDAHELSVRGWRLAYSLLRDVQEAEDAVQQAFVIAVSKPQAVPTDDLWPWFGTVIAHEARNARRKKARRKTGTAKTEDEMASIPDRGDSPATTAGDRDLAAVLGAALNRLPNEEREALVLVHAGGLSFSSAAVCMGVAKGTFAHFVERGILKLRKEHGTDQTRIANLLAVVPVAPIPAGLVSSVNTTLASAVSQLPAGTKIMGVVAMNKLLTAIVMIIVVALLIGLAAVALPIPPFADAACGSVDGGSAFDALMDKHGSQGGNGPLDTVSVPGDKSAGQGKAADQGEGTESREGLDSRTTPSTQNGGAGAAPPKTDSTIPVMPPATGAEGATRFPQEITVGAPVQELGSLPPWDTGGDVYDMALSPDGNQLVIGSSDALRALDAQTGEQLWAKSIPEISCYGLTYTADSARVISVGRNREVEAFSSSNGDRLQGYNSKARSNSVTLSHDGKLAVVSYSSEKAVQLWNADTLESAGAFKDQERQYTRAFISADNSKVFALSNSSRGSYDKEKHGNCLVCWDVGTGLREYELSGNDLGLFFRDCCVALDGSFALFEASRNDSDVLSELIVRIDLPSGTVKYTLESTMRFACGVALSRDGTLAASRIDSELVLWNTSDGKVELRIPQSHPAGVLKFSHDGARIYSAFACDRVRVWDTKTGEPLSSDSAVISAHSQPVTRIKFTDDGKYCVSLDRGGRLITWDVATGRLVASIEHPENIQDFTLCGGNLAATVNDHGVIVLWNVDTGKLLRELARSDDPDDSSFQLQFSPASGRIFRLSNSGVVIWDLAGGTVLHTLALPEVEGPWSSTMMPRCFAVSPDGSAAAISFLNDTIWRMDVDTGGWRLLYAPAEGLGQISFDASGRLWYCGDLLNSHLGALNFDDGRVIANLCFTSADFNTFATSPDGKHAIAAGWNRAGQQGAFWLDLVHGVLTARFLGHSGKVTAVAISPDGTIAATGGDDKIVRLWDLTVVQD